MKRKNKKNFKKDTYNNKAQSKQIAKNTKAIKQLKAAPERKVIINFRSLSAAVAGTHQNPLDTIAQGTGDSQRIGDVIQLKFFELNLNTHSIPDNVNQLQSTFRFIVICDTQNNNSATAIPTFELFEQDGSNDQMCVSTFNDEYVGKGKRYNILWDSGCIVLGNRCGAYYKTYRKRIPLQYKVHYSSNFGTSLDIIDKCISLYSIHSNINHHWGFSSKILFTDC